MKYNRTQRTGLSIIEVLTSIVVAMIGVFGIMVMIPFSVKQSKTGLDRDAATVLARGAMAQMEVKGYRNPEAWIDAAGAVAPTPPQTYMLDPLMVEENAAFLTFPFNDNNLDGSNDVFPATYNIPSATIRGATGVRIPLAEARRMFVGKNELTFEDTEDEFAGPIQLFDASSTGVENIRRQYQGSLSWSVLMVPYKANPAVNVGAAWSYRAYVIVYKSRSVDTTSIDSQMFAANVIHAGMPSTPLGPASPVGAVYLDTSVPLTDDYNIAKDSWVMMINKRAVPATEAGFENQIGFYRVVNYDINEVPGNRTLNSITLDGPDFNFGDPSDAANWDPQGTFIVHLKDVIAVYERNITPESPSNWNLTF